MLPSIINRIRGFCNGAGEIIHKCIYWLKFLVAKFIWAGYHKYTLKKAVNAVAGRLRPGQDSQIRIQSMKYIKKRKILKNLHTRCVFFLLLFVTAVHILAWNSKPFTNWYRLNLFPLWTGIIGRISSLTHGSVGEILIIAGVCLTVAEALLLILFLVKKGFERIQNKKQAGVSSGFYKWNRRFVCWVLVYIYVTETLNCYVLYHASTVEEQFYQGSDEEGMEELIAAYTETVTKANALSAKVARDADGQAVYEGTQQQLYDACKKAMKKQGKKYPYLAGYYPDPKPVRASHFMSQQHLLGIYFPFTMEANYNTVMYPLNVPATICHEFSHLKGIILEDEANFFGFAACIESEDVYLQYSGYLSVLGYLARQVRKSVPEEIRKTMPVADEQVIQDDVFLTQAQWAQVEERAVMPTETVNKATNVFLEKNLTMNGIEDGIQSYSRVVRLVVKYYAD